MGVSVYPVLNQEIPSFDVTEVSGKALADVIFEDGSFCAPLLRFRSDNAEALADFIADQTGKDRSAIKVPAEEWFDPEDGLQVVRRLLEQVRSHPQGVLQIPPGWEPVAFIAGLIDDLTHLETALMLAQNHQALFHLALDF